MERRTYLEDSGTTLPLILPLILTLTLTLVEESRMRAVFDHLDVDKNGVIDLEDL